MPDSIFEFLTSYTITVFDRMTRYADKISVTFGLDCGTGVSGYISILVLA